MATCGYPNGFAAWKSYIVFDARLKKVTRRYDNRIKEPKTQA
jgi:hypothetical protein